MSKKLHLGCGKRFLEGYIHIDIDSYPHIDYISKIENLSMFEDNSIDLIYASHCIEYFDRYEVINVLEEWKRVLKNDGILRISVPDFKSLLKVYKKTNNIDKILGPVYGRWNVGKSKYIYHKTMYDHQSLKNVLEKSGFKNITKWDWKEVFKNQPEYDDHSQAYFPHMDKENGIQISLNLECRNSG